MTHRPTLLQAATLLTIALAVSAPAQTAPSAPPPSAGTPSTDAESVLVLNPFTVSTERDNGFVAASSLAGGRLASDLRDTAVDYSVQTREFLDALNLTNLVEASRWTVNSYDIGDDGNETTFNNPLSNQVRFRGLSANTQQIDFFPVNYNYDTFSIERLDYARGASGVLFGTGSFSGTPNAVLKRARTDRTFGEMRLTGGSWDYYRATLDANYALRRNLAVRLNLLGQDAHTNRQFELDRRKAIALGVTFRPWNGAEFNFSGETGRFDKIVGPTQYRDFVSGWNGRTVFTGIQGARAGSGQYPTTNPNPNQAGVQRLGNDTTPYYVIVASNPALRLVDYANTARSMGAGENNNGANGTGIGGVLFPPAGVAATGLSGANLLNATGRPDGMFDVALANSRFFIPSREMSLVGATPNNIQDYDTLTLTGTQQIGRHLFLEAAANFADRKAKSKLTIANTLATYIDLNRDLPDGTPNPHFLEGYADQTSGWIRNHNISRNVRAGAALVFNDTRFGSFTLSLSAGNSLSTNYRRRTVYSVLDPLVDPRRWPTTNVPRLRLYFNQPTYNDDPPGEITLSSTRFVGTGPDATPVTTSRTVQTGYTTTEGTRNRTDSNYQLAAFQAKLLKKRLNLLLAARRDDFETTSLNMWGAQQRLYELPANWNGTDEVYKPAAPADYARLSYTPKDATGRPNGAPQNAVARPRDGNGVPLPQYAGDRFQDDYSNPRIAVADTVISAGAVLHVTRWASLTAGYGETFNAPSSSARITGEEFGPVLSSTKSYGVRFDLPGNRLSATLTRYTGKQDNVAVSANAGLPTNLTQWAYLNQIINANRYDDASPDGINQRGVAPVPVNFAELASRKTEGYEFEIVANPVRGLRISANYARPRATLEGGFADTRAYIAQFEPALKQIVEDAGVFIDPQTNRARSRTADDGPPAAGIDAGNAALGWNSLQDAKRAMTASSTRENRSARYTVNLFADYTFTQGWMKDLRVGAGVNFRGKSIVGNRGTDTIRDPNNPNAAIDDPSVGASDYVWADGYHQVTATLGYQFRLNRKLQMRVDLKVDNLTDFDEALYNASTSRIVGGDITNPARQNQVDGAYYPRPRYWELSTTLRF
jgi:outer membrane receptor protein involved in Fe transport